MLQTLYRLLLQFLCQFESVWNEGMWNVQSRMKGHACGSTKVSRLCGESRPPEPLWCMRTTTECSSGFLFSLLKQVLVYGHKMTTFISFTWQKSVKMKSPLVQKETTIAVFHVGVELWLCMQTQSKHAPMRPYFFIYI